jgi:hypothetical protein
VFNNSVVTYTENLGICTLKKFSNEKYNIIEASVYANDRRDTATNP